MRFWVTFVLAIACVSCKSVHRSELQDVEAGDSQTAIDEKNQQFIVATIF